MLSRTLALHDVRDVEALAIYVVSTSRFTLSRSEREDLEAHLIATCWELSTRYEPGGSVRFSTWATTTLKLRVIDWVRKERGRTRWVFGDGSVREFERPAVESLEERRERGLFEPVGGGGLDDAGDRFSDQLRALRARSSPPAGYHDRLGSGTARRAR